MRVELQPTKTSELNTRPLAWQFCKLISSMCTIHRLNNNKLLLLCLWHNPWLDMHMNTLHFHYKCMSRQKA